VTERWRKKLEGIDQVGPSDDVYERAKAGPTVPETQSPMQRTSTRVATAIAAFVVFALAISLFAIPTLRLHDQSGALSPGGQLLPLWPARTTDEVQALQAQADSGDAAWALDPRQVATRFGQAVLGWPKAWASPVTSAGGCSVASGSNSSGSYAANSFAGRCPATGFEDYGPVAYPPTGACDPSMLLCGGSSSEPGSTNSSAGQFITFQLLPCDPTTSCNLASILETVELFQPLGAGEGNVWSVLQANSSLVDLAVSPGQTVSNGSSLSTGLRIPPDEQFGFGLHVGASDSCRQGVATDVFHSPGSPNDAVTAAGSELGVNLGSRDGTSCAQEEPGYVFVATSERTIVSDGVPIDPLQGAGGPGLLLTSFAAVPINFEWPDASASSIAPTSATTTGWTTYTDPLGWTIDVPRDWVTKKIDGADARQVYEGAAFGSSTPDQQPGGPTTIGAPPGEVTLLLYHAEGGPPVPRRTTAALRHRWAISRSSRVGTNPTSQRTGSPSRYPSVSVATRRPPNSSRSCSRWCLRSRSNRGPRVSRAMDSPLSTRVRRRRSSGSKQASIGKSSGKTSTCSCRTAGTEYSSDQCPTAGREKRNRQASTRAVRSFSALMERTRGGRSTVNRSRPTQQASSSLCR
jgi:hypothetical protein